MIVDSSPAAAMSRSISAWSTAIGFGCWKNGCGVWCGDERNTTRRADVARRSTAAGAVVGRAVQTRKTVLTPLSPASSDSGTVRSPVTTSTPAGSAASAPERPVGTPTAPAPGGVRVVVHHLGHGRRRGAGRVDVVHPVGGPLQRLRFPAELLAPVGIARPEAQLAGHRGQQRPSGLVVAFPGQLAG